MSVFIGSNEITDAYVGSNQVQEIWVGSTRVYQNAVYTWTEQADGTWADDDPSGGTQGTVSYPTGAVQLIRTSGGTATHGLYINAGLLANTDYTVEIEFGSFAPDNSATIFLGSNGDRFPTTSVTVATTSNSNANWQNQTISGSVSVGGTALPYVIVQTANHNNGEAYVINKVTIREN